jgi:hypothetical protein
MKREPYFGEHKPHVKIIQLQSHAIQNIRNSKIDDNLDALFGKQGRPKYIPYKFKKSGYRFHKDP